MARIDREALNLPKHPAWGWITCPTCQGDECETGFCDLCVGEGYFWDSPRVQDPLDVMRCKRRFVKRIATDGYVYRVTRQRAERAIRCDLAARAAVQAWRAAA